MKHIVKYCFLLFPLITACVTTQEKKKREMYNKEVAEGSRRMLVDSTVKVKELEEQLARASGEIEELAQEQKQIKKQMEQTTDNKLSVVNLKMELENQRSQIEMLEKKVEKQADYIQEVLKTLKKMSAPSPQVSKSKTSNSTLFEKGLVDYQKKRFKSAKKNLEQSLANEDLTNTQINIARHRLGLMEYENSNYEASIIHMSKIYPKWPRSSMAPDALYYMGLSLEKLKKSQEAKEAFAKFLKEYPDHDWAKAIKSKK